MPKNRNASAWIEAAGDKGLNLDFLHQDKLRIQDVLKELGLPVDSAYILNPNELSSKKVKEIIGRVECFCRLVPRHGGFRPYIYPITSATQLRNFCGKYDLSKYAIMLVEKGNITHTGCIIAQDDSPGMPGKCLIELVEGSGEDLFHGLKTPIHASIDSRLNWFRTVRYDNKTTEEEKRLVLSALRMVGGPKHPFPGYFEFDVYDRTKISFRNYQGPNTQYAKR